MPAWAAPPGGPTTVDADPWPDEITPEWAFGGTDGAGVRVCVLDSGVDGGHPMVGPVDASMGVQIDESGAARVVPVEATDMAGHGTACAGVIRSLAPRCTLASVRVLTDGTQGGGAGLLAGLRWAIDNGYDVINLSLSTSKPGLRTELAELCDSAYYRRTLICASAHNNPVVSFPWYFAAVVSVASVSTADNGGTRGSRHYYNACPPVEFFAPGVGVEVAWADRKVIRATGNSFATPYLSGLCALLISKHPALTPFQVKTLLYLTAANVGVNHAR
jgi:subtilisin family serine protease